MHIFRLFEILAGEDGHNFIESFEPFLKCENITVLF